MIFIYTHFEITNGKFSFFTFSIFTYCLTPHCRVEEGGGEVVDNGDRENYRKQPITTATTITKILNEKLLLLKKIT